MWTRKELKTRAKKTFYGNYWRCVAVGLIFMLLFAGSAGGSSSAGQNESTQSIQELQAGLQSASAAGGVSVGVIIAAILGVFAVVFLISFLVNVFLIQPVSVGVSRFFMDNAKEPARVGTIFHGFKNGRYLKNVGTILVMNIFIALWSLLLVIPGIVKAYQYRMVTYLLAEDTELGVMECLRRSKEMMQGHKWNSFVLDLSFIGWGFLSAITCNIVGIFYVYPYILATDAELYLELKKNG